jgi:hypothetical protein
MPELPEWLVVDAEDGIVDPYRLLELSPDESDAHVIREALVRARGRIEDAGSGHSEADRRALATVLDRAEEILTDPRRKRAYDDLRRSRGRDAVSRTGRRSLALLSWLRELPVDQRWKLALTVAALSVSCLLVGQTIASRPVRFPPRVGGPPAVQGADTDSPRLPKPPRNASVPGLTIGIPRKLNGLEDEKGATDVTLSADLRILIFSRDVGRARGSDLFLTTRPGTRERFAKPQPMGAINSPSSERSPSLSRDGLELIFVRDGAAFVTSRASRSERFRTPEPLTIPGVEPEREIVTAAQIFSDGLSVAFRVQEKGGSARPHYVVAERAVAGSGFERVSAVELWRPRNVNIFSADGLRVYVDLEKGLSLSTRRSLDTKFGAPGLIQRLMATAIGPIEGSFCITPEEDVLFYSSAGPDVDTNLSKSNQPLYLWQILIR